jgi:hypothetical protein
MDTLEINSTHSLTTSMTDKRESGAHTYQINCHQFNAEYKIWQKKNESQGNAFGIRTLGFERIFVTAGEAAQIAAAIQTKRSPLALD